MGEDAYLQRPAVQGRSAPILGVDVDERRPALRQKAQIDLAGQCVATAVAVTHPTVLEWAAGHQRILLTHDVATISAFPCERVRAGKPMPCVFEVGRTVALRSAIDDIVLLATCSVTGEWEGQVRYLPLR